MKFENKDTFEQHNVFGMGEPNTAYARYFMGDSFLNPLTDTQCGLFAANVTFAPGCRNNWHIHHAKRGGGQLLICTAGEGWYQEEGKDAVSLCEGSVILIPVNVKHWHGAKRIAGFRILLLRYLVRIVLTNGVNLYLMLNMMYWKKKYGWRNNTCIRKLRN